MPMLEDVLREKTFKGQCDDNSHRVFYTLCKEGTPLPQTEREWEQHRVIKLLSSVLERLVEKNVLSEKDLDDVLLATVH